MITVVMFNTGQLTGAFPALAPVSWERATPANHGGGSPTPTLARNIAASIGAANMGAFQIGQLTQALLDLSTQQAAPLGSQPTFGQLLTDDERARLTRRESILLAGLSWVTANAAVVESARILRTSAYPTVGTETARIQALSITDTGAGRIVDEHPLLNQGDTVEVISDALAGANELRISLEILTDDESIVRAAIG